MESYDITKLRFIEAFREKNIDLFTSGDVRKVFEIKSEDTLKQLLKRLKDSNVIKPLIKDKYLFLHSKREISDFEIANFFVVPSYVSLESALSYYDLIDQFPYRITSLTVLKGREVKVLEKVFLYAKIKPEYFCDFVKLDNFLMATKEKAIFDYLYFIYKGLRPLSGLEDLKRYLKEKVLRDYIYSLGDKRFKRFVRKSC